MDRDTIENHVKNLGKRDFDAVARLVLTEFLGLRVVDVDRPGDGGSDLRPFEDRNGNAVRASLAIQKTVQYQKWRDKALEDAEKAKNSLGAKRFVFLTSRAHQSTSLRDVENTIATKFAMPATCLGATEIAGIIEQQGMLREFADAIGLQLNVVIADRPDRAEVLLHAYVALGSDRSDLRNEVYDDSLLLALHEANTGLVRDVVVTNALELLGAGEEVRDRVSRRIDSLLARKLIEPVVQGAVRLTENSKLRLQAADGIYIRELEHLASAQSQVLKDVCGIEWDQKQCELASMLLSRWFIHRQLVTAEHTSVPLTKMGLSRCLGNPEQELADLLRDAGVQPALTSKVLGEFVDLARGMPLIKKLTKAVTYVATEGQDLLKASRVLGASRWSDVRVTLDASVAIPYLCASLFLPTLGRFSFGANECIKLLKRHGAALVIPWVYINEVAAHLCRAVQYPAIPEFSESLEHSENGFVAHYFQLRAAGRNVPPSLREFIGQFARTALRPKNTANETVRAVMAEIQPALAEYGVDFDDISR